jgi:GLPGLI family protein
MVMKKSILMILVMLTGSLMFAQQGGTGILMSGAVIYEQIVKLDIQLEGEAAQFAHMLPKERKSEKILHFTEEASLYENHHSEDLEEPMDMDGGGTMMIKMAEPDNKVFTDLSKGLQIEQKEFMSRLFLIESALEKGAWKITGSQKRILEYPCQEAITEEDDKVVRVWFTPNIAIPAGPVGYGNLPGLVLGVDIDEGEHIILATSIELKPVDKALLKKPGKGKKVTQEEYQAIVEEKMKEMGAEQEGGSGHAVVVKIRQ